MMIDEYRKPDPVVVPKAPEESQETKEFNDTILKEYLETKAASEARSIPRKVHAETRVVADLINSPPHYQRFGIECADLIDELDLPRWLAQSFKYLYRRGYKGREYTVAREISDLEKSVFYLNRHIDLLKKKIDA